MNNLMLQQVQTDSKIVVDQIVVDRERNENKEAIAEGLQKMKKHAAKYQKEPIMVKRSTRNLDKISKKKRRCWAGSW